VFPPLTHHASNPKCTGKTPQFPKEMAPREKGELKLVI
jgi:hypothetical protein